MEMPFDHLENHESSDTASHRTQSTREGPNMVVNLCLPECDASLGIGLSIQLTVRCVADEPYQGQDRAATQQYRCLASIQML
jgi:hypothetical protein